MFRVKTLKKGVENYAKERWCKADIVLYVDEIGNKSVLAERKNCYAMVVAMEQFVDGKWQAFDLTAFIGDRRLQAGIYKINVGA